MVIRRELMKQLGPVTEQNPRQTLKCTTWSSIPELFSKIHLLHGTHMPSCLEATAGGTLKSVPPPPHPHPTGDTQEGRTRCLRQGPWSQNAGIHG